MKSADLSAAPARDPLDVDTILKSAFNVSRYGAFAIEAPCTSCRRELDWTIATIVGRMPATIECPWCGSEEHWKPRV